MSSSPQAKEKLQMSNVEIGLASTRLKTAPILEVQNGTRESDGTYRQYSLSVPPGMRSPWEAMAWTYGLRPAQSDLAVRT
jgi:hypothetical protein